MPTPEKLYDCTGCGERKPKDKFPDAPVIPGLCEDCDKLMRVGDVGASDKPGSAAVIVAEGYHRLKAENERIRDALSVSIARWREKAAAFERRSSTVEGPMDDVLLSKASTLRTCALDVEDTITPNDQAQEQPPAATPERKTKDQT